MPEAEYKIHLPSTPTPEQIEALGALVNHFGGVIVEVPPTIEAEKPTALVPGEPEALASFAFPLAARDEQTTVLEGEGLHEQHRKELRQNLLQQSTDITIHYRYLFDSKLPTPRRTIFGKPKAGKPITWQYTHLDSPDPLTYSFVMDYVPGEKNLPRQVLMDVRNKDEDRHGYWYFKGVTPTVTINFDTIGNIEKIGLKCMDVSDNTLYRLLHDTTTREVMNRIGFTEDINKWEVTVDLMQNQLDFNQSVGGLDKYGSVDVRSTYYLEKAIDNGGNVPRFTRDTAWKEETPRSRGRLPKGSTISVDEYFAITKELLALIPADSANA